MKYVTLGIIGHVDHGKTTLVKALTGDDTDRLKEEKERGISIVLGYSRLNLPNGEIGIVDVPGHEKFIRTMVSGATAIEAVLLVVDVNESVKPQTIEHIDIAGLLGIEQGVVAVTKCDVAQPGQLESTLEDLEILLDGTFLEGAPVVTVSAVSGEGIDALKDELDTVLANSRPLLDEGFAYLPVDRVFSMSGFGTVVTGTLRRGSIRVGDEIEVYPHGIRAKVRELQSHNESTEQARPGFRTAVNLRGVEKQSLERGNVIATPGTIASAPVLSATLRLLKDAGAPLKHGQAIRLLLGTQETYPRLHLLDRNQLLPGEDCVLQFKHEQNVAAIPAEPFIIRTYSPMRTIGGGTILGSSEGRFKRRDDSVIARLEIVARGTPAEILESKLRDATKEPIEVQQLSRDARLPREKVDEHLRAMPVRFLNENRVVHNETYEALCTRLTEILSEFHTKNKTMPGLPKAQLDLGVRDDLSEHIVGALHEAGTIKLEKGLLSLSSFDAAASLDDTDRAIADEIEEVFKNGAFQPPGLNEVLQKGLSQASLRARGLSLNDYTHRRQKMYRYLLDKQVLVAAHQPNKNRSANTAIVFHQTTVEETKTRLRDAFGEANKFTTAEAKVLLNISRKFLVPLLEHLDSAGFTRRIEDFRTFSKQ